MKKLNERRVTVSSKIVNEIFRLVYTSLWTPSHHMRAESSAYDAMKCTADGMIRLVRGEEWLAGDMEVLETAREYSVRLTADVERLFADNLITNAMREEALDVMVGIKGAIDDLDRE